MGFHGGAVDEHLGWRSPSLSEGMEQVPPHALGRPPNKAIVEGLGRPIRGRCVDPARA